MWLGDVDIMAAAVAALAAAAVAVAAATVEGAMVYPL